MFLKNEINKPILNRNLCHHPNIYLVFLRLSLTSPEQEHVWVTSVVTSHAKCHTFVKCLKNNKKKIVINFSKMCLQT